MFGLHKRFFLGLIVVLLPGCQAKNKKREDKSKKKREEDFLSLILCSQELTENKKKFLQLILGHTN